MYKGCTTARWTRATRRAPSRRGASRAMPRNRDRDRRRRTADTGIFQPERAVIGFAIARRAQVDSDSSHRLLRRLRTERRPRFDLRHVNQGQRRLVLIAAHTGPRVIGRGEHSAGHDQVVGATGTKAAEVSGAAVVAEIQIAGGSGAERQQVLGGQRRVAAVVA